jgi:hypothetical protein
VVGVSRASPAAPFAVWPQASSGSGYTALLRAHRNYENGLLTGEVFGRELVFASAEYVRPIPLQIGPATLKVAGFVDTAQARHRVNGLTSPFHVDIGAGVRVNAGRAGSQVRLDIARGLRDGLTRVSAAYVQPWGQR